MFFEFRSWGGRRCCYPV